MTTPTLDRVALPVPILGQPHWRVVIRPERHLPDRIAGLPELTSLVTRATVRLGGWEYPDVHPGVGSTSRDANSIASWAESGSHLEYWRFFMSGQFLHLFSFAEDAQPFLSTSDPPPVVARAVRHAPAGFQPSGWVDFATLLQITTLIYEFAARLALTGTFGDAVVIEISLRHVKDRVLTSLNSRRWWSSFCAATVDSLEFGLDVQDSRQLVARRRELAVDAATFFYQRFGWNGWDRQMLTAEQAKLVENIFE